MKQHTKLSNGHSAKDNLEIAKRNFQEILMKIDSCRLPQRLVQHWNIYSNLKREPASYNSYKKYFSGLILFWIGHYFFNNLYSKFENKCLVENTVLSQKLFRPAEDCSVCLDVHEIERLSHVDRVLFEQRYAYSGRPVIVKDAADNWTAMNVFSYSFLKKLYEDKDADCQFFPYKTEFRSLREVFNMSTDRASLKSGTKPWYVGWSNCDQSIGSILRQHYTRPYFLPENAENERTDWIFMGSNGYGAPMHIDDVGYPSWQAQVLGKKLWTLEPPRECLYTCDKLEAVVNPGEIIVLDTNRWYHQTQIMSKDISITIGAEYD